MARMDCKARVSMGVLVGLVVLLTLPSYGQADGFMFVHWQHVYEQMREDRQLAVIELMAKDKAKVDLFVSLADGTGESNEVKFVLPFHGTPETFDVHEEEASAFVAALTDPLDAALAQVERERVRVGWRLIPGALLLNGGWGMPVLLGLVGLTGCGARGPTPTQTFFTEHSKIEIYDITEATDLDALIEATDLNPAVKEKLRSMSGEQMAIVTMWTNPVEEESRAGDMVYGGELADQPGLHLTWLVPLRPQSEGLGYRYPLGTGELWANPIPLTQLYVKAPPEANFTVSYPSLGEKSRRSDPYMLMWDSLSPDGTHHSKYNLSEARTPEAHLWRVMYTYSNSPEDLVVTRLADLSPAQMQIVHLRRQFVAWADRWTWLLGLLVATACWVAVWRYFMSRRLDIDYSWGRWRFWRDSLGWLLIYPTLVLLIFGIPAGGLYLGNRALRELPYDVASGIISILSPVVVLLPIAAILPTPLSAFLFACSQTAHTRNPFGRLFSWYLGTAIIASAAYGVLGLVWVQVIQWAQTV